MASPPRPPRARGWPLLGRLPAFALDLPGLCRQAARLGPIVDISPGHPAFLINDPDLVGQVLVGRQRDFGKIPDSPLRFLVGNGLFTNEDPADHRRQRRLMQPAFHRSRVAAFGELMNQAAQRRLQRWPDQGRQDVHAEMMALTMTIVARCLFGVDLDAPGDLAGDAPSYDLAPRDLTRALAGLTGQMPPFGLALLLGPWLHRHADRVTPRLERDNAVLERFVVDLIARRRAAPEPADDLLAMLLAARDDTDGSGGPTTGMSDRQVRDEILTLFVAGHETTANALAWTLFLLAGHPEIQERLAAEVAAVAGDQPVEASDLDRLSYTKMVLSEAMRLYPPVWLLMRQAVTSTTLAGAKLPAGSHVFIAPLFLHRDPTLWDDAEQFRPERFAPEGTGSPHRYAYIPFGAGPRLCLGEPFAWLEGVLLLAALIRQFRFGLLAPDQRAALAPRATLQPRGGLPLIVRRVAGPPPQLRSRR